MEMNRPITDQHEVANPLQQAGITQKSLSGQFSGKLSLCSWAPGRLDIFHCGSNAKVYHKWKRTAGEGWAPSTTDWESLDGEIPWSTVTAVSWGPNRIDLFGLGPDNDCHHKWCEGSSWSSWQKLGGRSFSDVVAVTWGPGILHLFVRGGNNMVFHMHMTSPNQWTLWNALPSLQIIGSPKAVVSCAGRIDLFVRDIQGNLYHKFYRDDAWDETWQSIGPRLVDEVAVAAISPNNNIGVTTRDADGKVLYKEWDSSTNKWLPSETGWSNLDDLTPGDTAHPKAYSTPAIAAWKQQGRISIAIQGVDNSLWLKERDPKYSGWGSWRQLSGQYTIMDPPVLDPRGGENMECCLPIFTRAPDASMICFD
ncbi:fucose-specific lectin [Thozetella sp. PMI_491]|nr:fucose-specific lectin [Thozetella sp. PMI_491]